MVCYILACRGYLSHQQQCSLLHGSCCHEFHNQSFFQWGQFHIIFGHLKSQDLASKSGVHRYPGCCWPSTSFFPFAIVAMFSPILVQSINEILCQQKSNKIKLFCIWNFIFIFIQYVNKSTLSRCKDTSNASRCWKSNNDTKVKTTGMSYTLQ